MDWPKAKSILIIAFLALNIYLGYLLYYLPRLEAPETVLTDEALAEVRFLAQHFNVTIDTEPKPLAVAALPLVGISEISLDEGMAALLAERWLGPETEESKQENGLLFTAGERELLLSQDSPYFYTLAYRDQSVSLEPPPTLSAEEATSVAQAFLKESIDPEVFSGYAVNMLLPLPEGEGYLVEFSAMKQGLPLFLDSYRFTVAGDKVVSFVAKQAQVGEQQGPLITVVTAEPATRRFLARLGEPQITGLTVQDLSLGYDVGVEVDGRLEIEPVWRFYLNEEDGGEVTIPAGYAYWVSPGYVKHYKVMTKRPADLAFVPHNATMALRAAK